MNGDASPMPRFFFDLATPAGLERDDTGSVFDSLETAYLDGSQAAVEISIDLLRDRHDPSRHRFEVRDEEGQVVLEIPFGEVLRPGRSATPHPGPPGMQARLEAAFERNRELKSELALAVAEARERLRTARAILRGERGE